MAATDLVTLSDVKAWLDIKNSDDDALLSLAITRVSAQIYNFISSNLLTNTYTEKYSGAGTGNRLMLRQQPITAVSSLSIGGVAIPASSDGISGAGYFFDDRMVYLIGHSFCRGDLNIAITYTAGYSVIPDAVIEAALELVTDRYRLRGRVGEKSKALPQGGSVSYDMSFLPDRVKSALAPYRRVWTP